MDETSAHATLAASVAEIEGPAVTTAIPASEIETALGSETPPDLVLEVVRTAGASGDAKIERTRVAVAWERTDLERLLSQADGGSVLLAFDAQALDRAFTEEVEAHGLRQTAAAFGVLAAVAAGTAHQAAAALEEKAAVRGSPAGTVSPTAAAQPAPESVAPAARDVADELGLIGGGQQAPAEFGMPRAMPTDYPAATESTGGGITVPEPGTAAAIAGGVLLAIAGAAFAARRRRVEPA